jgi:hypothetical protein
MIPSAFLFAARAGAMKKTAPARQMFSTEEDEVLRQLVAQFGEHDWKAIASKMPNRTTRQCRERYKNYLSPALTNQPYSTAEDDLLREKVAEIGPKWATISGFFKGRSDVALKNRWAALNARSTRSPPPADQTTPSSDQRPPETTTITLPADFRVDLRPEKGSMAHTFPNYGGRIW